MIYCVNRVGHQKSRVLIILVISQNLAVFMYHAFLALDHQALVLVHAADAADDVVVFVDVVSVVAVH